MNGVQFPAAFRSRMSTQLGPEWSQFESAHQTVSPVSIRLNPAKPFFVSDYPVVPWCRWGRLLPQRPVFTLDPLFHAGVYYVQEASSMFLEQAMQQACDLS